MDDKAELIDVVSDNTPIKVNATILAIIGFLVVQASLISFFFGGLYTTVTRNTGIIQEIQTTGSNRLQGDERILDLMQKHLDNLELLETQQNNGISAIDKKLIAHEDVDKRLEDRLNYVNERITHLNNSTVR